VFVLVAVHALPIHKQKIKNKGLLFLKNSTGALAEIFGNDKTKFTVIFWRLIKNPAVAGLIIYVLN
jgi:hypothetical protein